MPTEKQNVLLAEISFMYDSYEPCSTYHRIVTKNSEQLVNELNQHYLNRDTKQPLSLSDIEKSIADSMSELTLTPIDRSIVKKNQDLDLLFLEIHTVPAIL